MLLSTQSGSRTRKHLFLKQVALPVCVPERVFVAFRSAKERSTLFFLLRSICPRASSGSRTHTFALEEQQAAVTSWTQLIESRIGFAAAADHRADRLEAYPTYLFSQSAWRELNPLPVAYKTTALTA